ncbi:PEX2 [[Candida] subhashii]|uniref:PEX2 n=1 Tax=[Candida] subhashii TaxID=561895 RepID=A0A8J5UM29_9ASCO|nr:PEX2 [[Candida] subhashii]KAG7665928.1 PEX2 [[Candida] subhashii]
MIPISYPSPRVSQLDASILDSELFTLLKEQLSSIFQLHNNSKYSFGQHPELYSLLLNLVIFRQTIWKSGSSYGLSLQNLRLTDIKNGKIIGNSKRGLLLAVLILQYLYGRLQTYLYGFDESIEEGTSSNSISTKLKNYLVSNRSLILNKIDNTLKLANLINFTVFLIDGKYPSVVHRLFGIMGHAPTITPYTNLPIHECAICHDNNNQASSTGARTFPSAGPVTNPYITNCGHIYCYVCIAARFNMISKGGEDLPCLRCGQRLEWFQELDSDEQAIDKDAITIANEQEEDEVDEVDFDDNESIVSDDDGNLTPYDPGHLSTSRIDRQMSSVSAIFDADSHESTSSEGEFSEEEDFEEEAAAFM